MLRGVIAPVITVFNDNGALDETKSRNHMEWMLQKGVKGLFVTGTYGSGYMMTVAERARMMEIALDVVDHYMHSFVIAHVGDSSAENSMQLARIAEELKVEGISAISPLFYDYSEKEILNYYAALRNMTDIPIYAYNNPGVTHNSFSPELLRRIRSIGLAGVKDSSNSIVLANTVFAENIERNEDGAAFQYIPGNAKGWPLFKNIGAESMIAGMCNYLPEIIVSLYNASHDSEEKMMQIYNIMIDLDKKLKFTTSIHVCHLCLKARGRKAGYARFPLETDYSGMENRMMEIDKVMEDAIGSVKKIME